jgi:hypothetical protein
MVRESEQLRQLADQHGRRDAVHVSVANRLGKKLGDETESAQPGQHAKDAGYDGHRAGQSDCAIGIARGKRQNDGEDDGGERRIRPEHQNAARAEQRIGQQRDNGRIQAGDPRQARCLRIGNADRHQHCRQNEPRHEIIPQPAGLVVAQDVEARHPSQPAIRLRSTSPEPDTAGFRRLRYKGFAHTLQRNDSPNATQQQRQGVCQRGPAYSTIKGHRAPPRIPIQIEFHYPSCST